MSFCVGRLLLFTPARGKYSNPGQRLEQMNAHDAVTLKG